MIEHQAGSAGEGRRFGIVVSRFNAWVTRALLAGARDALLRHGVAEDAIEVVWVPGAWEIPLALRRLGRTGRFDGLVALGAVIRGSTPHFDHVSAGVASGTASASLELDLPVGFGVLTTETIGAGDGARREQGGQQGVGRRTGRAGDGAAAGGGVGEGA